jgi:predicted transcriptional regulator/DNA-binding XRE family transcriptional regulator
MSELSGRVIKATYAERDESIGSSLKRIRESCGLTQAQLARRLDVKQAAISKIEKRDDLQLATVRKYVEALGAKLNIDAEFSANSPMGLRLLNAFEVDLSDDNQLILPIFREEPFRQNRDVVLSIKPQYSEKIIEGLKTVELRRRFPAAPPKGTIAYIYSTSPVRAMVGTAEIDGVAKLPIDSLWAEYSKDAFIEKRDFYNYFDGVDEGYALHFKNVNSFDEPLSLEFLRSRFGFEPPQSFLYAKHNFREALSGDHTVVSH